VPFFREHYKGVLIGNQNYNGDSAEKDLSSKLIDLASFGRLHIVNPDLYERLVGGHPI